MRKQYHFWLGENGLDAWDVDRLVAAVDLSYPIVLGYDGRVMDGVHRIVRTYLEARPTIQAGQFPARLEADYRNCRPEDLHSCTTALVVASSRRAT